MAKKISLIIPVFNEEGSLKELHQKIIQACEKFDLEIIFVDDGSTDKSLKVLKQIAQNDLKIRVISFRRNFGQTAAIAAGFDAAKGDVLVTLDADLQNDPQDIPNLLKLIDEGNDVVSGWRRKRNDPLIFKKVPSFIANSLISAVTGVRLHDFGCTLKAYRREIIKDIKLYGEMHRFLPALASWSGAKIAEVEVRHFPRICGKSKYGLSRTFKVIIDLITIKFFLSYSTRPNYIFTGLGISSLLLGFFSMAIVAYRVLLLRHLEATPLIFLMTIFFLGGIQLILMGFLAEILTRAHFESQNKPVYFIKEKINF